MQNGGCIGLTLPPGNVYWICTQPGVTGRILPSFDPTLGHITNDGTAQWTSIGPADVPIGGYPWQHAQYELLANG